MNRIFIYGDLEEESKEKETPDATYSPTAQTHGGAVVIDELGNVITYDGNGRLVKKEHPDGTTTYYPTKKTEPSEYDFTETSLRETAAAIASDFIKEFTGLNLYDVLESLEREGVLWGDIKGILGLFIPLPHSLPKTAAITEIAMQSVITFQPEKVAYTKLLSLMTDALFKVLQKECANA